MYIYFPMQTLFLSAFCILVFATGLFRDSAIYIHYLANRTEIIALFCVNKDIPEMKCNGKCHLKDQLERQNDQESAPPAEFSFKRLHFFTTDNDFKFYLYFTVEKSNPIPDPAPSVLNGYSVVDLPPPRFS